MFDIADIVKFETAVPAAFRTAGKSPADPEHETRLACRDLFRSTRLMQRLVPLINEVLTIQGALPPPDQSEAMPIAFEDEEPTGDAGHRS